MHWDASALAGTYFRSVTALRWIKTLPACLPSTAEVLARHRSGGHAVQIYNRIAVAQDPDWVLLNSDPEIGAWRMPNPPRAMLYWREHRQNPLVPVRSEWVLLHDIHGVLCLVIVAR